MAQVIYKGLADVRTLGANDLKAHGLEGFETTEFRRHQAVEISDEAAKLILSKPRIFGRFIELTKERVEALETQAAEAEAAALEQTGQADSTSQLGVDSPAGSTAADTPSTGSTRRSKS